MAGATLGIAPNDLSNIWTGLLPGDRRRAGIIQVFHSVMACTSYSNFLCAFFSFEETLNVSRSRDRRNSFYVPNPTFHRFIDETDV